MNIVSRKYREWNRPAAGGEPGGGKADARFGHGACAWIRARGCIFRAGKSACSARSRAARRRSAENAARSRPPWNGSTTTRGAWKPIANRRARSGADGCPPCRDCRASPCSLARSWKAAARRSPRRGWKVRCWPLTMCKRSPWRNCGPWRRRCASSCAIASSAWRARRSRARKNGWTLQRWVDAGAPKGELGGKARGSAFFARALQLVSELERRTPASDRAPLGATRRQRGARDRPSARAAGHGAHAHGKFVRGEATGGFPGLAGSVWPREPGGTGIEPGSFRRVPADGGSLQSAGARTRADAGQPAGIGEATVARQAVAAAQKEEGARGCACWWLCDDAGCAEFKSQIGAGDVRVRALSPWIPEGYGYMGCVLAAALVVWLAFAWCSRSVGLSLLAIPVAWAAGAGRGAGDFAQAGTPGALIKAGTEHIPREWPRWSPFPRCSLRPRARRNWRGNWKCSAAWKRRKTSAFCCWAIFATLSGRACPEDETILATVRAQIRAMNERAGREKYFFLHRERAHNPRTARGWGASASAAR